jgi:hypothetical protein
LTPSAKASLGEALVEYLVLVLPVAFYVGLESYHRQEPSFFYSSPEWAIATIFLQFQGAYLFIKHSRRNIGKISEPRVTLLTLMALTVVVASAMNALESMHVESFGKILFRLVLFLLTTVLFLTLVASSKYKNGGNKVG